jgi:hypothetical protein
VKQTILFALTTAALALLGAFLLGGFFRGPGATRAIWWSAALAIVVQIGSFRIARRYAATGDVMKGWGIGALIRVIVLAAYGLSATRFGLPLGAALVSLAAFLFASMLVEPLFLTR